MSSLVLGVSVASSLAALMPSIFGMRTSSSAMSGSFSCARITASCPSAASATTRRSRAPSSSFLKLWRNSRSSSAISILIGIVGSLLLWIQRQRDGYREAFAGLALGPDLSVMRLGDELAVRQSQAGAGVEPLVA